MDNTCLSRLFPNLNFKLEKIVNKNLHLDTDAEKGRRMQALLDLAQSDQIAANKQEIEKLKARSEED